MTFTTDPGERRAFTNGLRELAAFIDADPQIPVPLYGMPILLHARGTDAEKFAAVDRIAGLLDVTPCHDGHYTATRHFGPVSYKAAAIPAAWDAEYQARHSYEDNITLTPWAARPRGLTATPR